MKRNFKRTAAALFAFATASSMIFSAAPTAFAEEIQAVISSEENVPVVAEGEFDFDSMEVT
ncbi:MAG: hypothetical protein ACI4JD_08740, partial [Ruminococcus sp.]